MKELTQDELQKIDGGIIFTTIFFIAATGVAVATAYNYNP